MRIETVAQNPYPAMESQGATKSGLYVGNIKAGNYQIKDGGDRPPGLIPAGHHQNMWATSKKWPKEVQPTSLDQGVEIMQWLAETWNGLTISQKETWRKEADRRRITLFAAFVKVNFTRMNGYLQPLLTFK